jgi:2-aminoethylphosphonate-pyruvate transaminase
MTGQGSVSLPTGKPDIAVILAAGMGTRLRNVLKDVPKGFLSIDGSSLIELSLRKLFGEGIKRIIIGTGHLSEAYEELAGKMGAISCVRNDAYASTGSMYTLYNLRDHIDGDFILLESDLIYEKSALEALISDGHRDVILSSGRTNSGDEVFLEVDGTRNLVNLSKDPARLSSIDSELVGISKLSLSVFRRLCEAAADKPDIDYERGFVEIAETCPLFVKKIDDLAWSEIDDEDHLRRALQTVYPRIKEREAHGTH